MENQVQVVENDEMEIDLKELFFELLSHWKLLAVSTLLVAVIAFMASRFLITPMYESTAELYVLSKSTSITSVADLQIGTNLTSDYMEVISGRPVLEQVITNLELDEDYASLYKKVSLENPSDSRIMKITVKDADPELAKTIADEVAEVSAAYIAEKMDQDPPNIIQYGYSDNEKVSPSVGKNTIIGAMLGFLLAAAVVTVSYLLNDTIINPDDLEKKLGLHVLASLPKDEEEDDGEGSKSEEHRIKKFTKKLGA